MESMLIHNGRVITLGQSRQLLDDGAVLIEDGLIVEVGSSADLLARHPGVPTLDARGMTVMPGLINVHHHLYSTFACGLACEPAANFVEILEKLWWKLDRALSLEDVRYSALIPVLRCIKSGCTTIVDHHASPNA